jgi:predicted ferric reductase
VNQALWYASRATGLVSLVLLTATMVLGLLGAGRVSLAGWPRFAMTWLHRNLSLLTVAFLALHVAGAVIDPYAGIRWADAVIPFTSTYQPLWLGLGAVALDLMIAMIATSLLRDRIGLRLWRVLHMSAYACWPVALAHGLGVGGADSRRLWVLAIDVLCLVAVAGALAVRVTTSHPDTVARQDVHPAMR